MADDTLKLTAEMAAGDSSAIRAFYERYFDWMYQQARRACRRDEAFCLDVVQEAVLRVIRAIRPAQTETQLRAWLRLVVQTTAYDFLRAQRRRKEHEFAAVPVQRENDSEQFDAVQLEWLTEQISRLDPRIVQIIQWRFGDQWTLRRIAEKLGVSLASVDGRLRRAMKVLRDRAAEDFDE